MKHPDALPLPRLGDVTAGIVVACLLVPQALAYAELAGVPAHIGFAAATLPPIVAAFFASSPYLQTGPVALTALLTFGALSSLSTPRSAEYVGLAALLALVVGVCRIVIGAVQWGWIAYLMSPPMMMGFSSAAGLLIIASQLPAALGVTTTTTDVVGGALQALAHPSAWQAPALLATAVTIALALGGRVVHPLFPGVLIAIVVGLLLGRSTYYTAPLLGVLPIRLPSLGTSLPWVHLPDLILPGAIIAVLGSAEPAAIARLYAARERMRWDPNREFIAQGAANLASAFAGGFPVGGSFSRTSANHMAGGKTRWSGALTGVIVLAFVPALGLLSSLPRAVLAAIIIAASIKLVTIGQIVGLYRQAPAQAGVAGLTFVLTLLLAPRIEQAVMAGILLATAVHLRRELTIRTEARFDTESETLTLKPRGVLFFASAPALETTLLDQLARHPEARRLVLRLEHLGRIDYSGAMLIKNVAAEAIAAGLEVRIAGTPPQARRILDRVIGNDSELFGSG